MTIYDRMKINFVIFKISAMISIMRLVSHYVCVLEICFINLSRKIRVTVTLTSLSTLYKFFYSSPLKSFKNIAQNDLPFLCTHLVYVFNIQMASFISVFCPFCQTLNNIRSKYKKQQKKNQSLRLAARLGRLIR